MVSVSEATSWAVRSSLEAKYRALRCHIAPLSKDTVEYSNVMSLIETTPNGWVYSKAISHIETTRNGWIYSIAISLIETAPNGLDYRMAISVIETAPSVTSWIHKCQITGEIKLQMTTLFAQKTWNQNCKMLCLPAPAYFFNYSFTVSLCHVRHVHMSLWVFSWVTMR